MTAWRAANKERLTAYAHSRYLIQKEDPRFCAAARERAAAWAKAHPDKVKARSEEYRASGKDLISSKAFAKRHPEKISAWRKRNYWSNPERARAKAIEWSEKNRKRCKANIARWKQENHGRVIAAVTARKGHVKRATPPWADRKQISDFYVGCPAGYHVDHIEPVRGENFCGLHVLWNLQYLPAIENLRKKNRLL